MKPCEILQFYEINSQVSKPNINRNIPREISDIGRSAHNLDYGSLKAALLGSFSACLAPGPCIITTQDMYSILLWCTQVISHSKFRKHQLDVYDLKELLQNTAITACSGKNLEHTKSLTHFDKLLLKKSSYIFPYLSSPLLESTQKLANREYLASDGAILKGFEATRKYVANGKSRCSNVKDMLILHYSRRTQQERNEINKCMSWISEDGHDEAFNEISLWRNGLAHGEDTSCLAGFSILGLCLSVLLSEICDEFEEARDSALHTSMVFYEKSDRPDWCFYPPA